MCLCVNYITQLPLVYLMFILRMKPELKIYFHLKAVWFGLNSTAYWFADM